jgi:hypothetical protein
MNNLQKTKKRLRKKLFQLQQQWEEELIYNLCDPEVRKLFQPSENMTAEQHFNHFMNVMRNVRCCKQNN